MKIDYKIKQFLTNENIISYRHKEDDKNIYLETWLYTDKFKEYQKNLFNDFFVEIIDILEKKDIFLDFKRELESKIKQFNIKLKVFQEKTNLEEKIEIRWNLQIIWWNYYLSTLIWESSIIIFRNKKLEIVVPNEIEEDDKIDIFSEIIEWELENDDMIVSIWCNIYNYLTDNEIKELIETEDIIETLTDILIIRIDEKEIWFISFINVQVEKILINQKKEINLEKYKTLINKNKYVIGVLIWLWIVFFIIVAIFSYLWDNKDKAVVKVGNKEIQLDLTNIKREIDMFSKLDTENTTEKQKRYEKIMKELKLYEQSGIQELEIKELKKKMEQNYFKGFNINIITENDGILNKVYKFTDTEKKQLWDLKWITKSRWTENVYSNKWVLIGITNNKLKWVIQSLKIPVNINSCINNLSNNGLYCVLDNNDIYNFSKYWASTLTNTDKSWPENIISLWKYGVNKLYVLTLDDKLNKKWIYIKRYLLKSKNNFSNPTNYIFSEEANKDLISGIYTGSSLAVDGSFLIWTKNGLVQAYRKNSFDSKLYIREIKWWEQWIIDKINDLKWKVKVIAKPWSSFVYLYDYNTRSLITYYSRYKNTDKAMYSYQLTYLFKIKIDLTNEEVKDITVDDNKLKPNAYILTDKNIYKVDLNQFRE
jgi:hypothetical protein